MEPGPGSDGEDGASAGYRLSATQAQSILDMRLNRLTGLEQDKIVAEYRSLIERIIDLVEILEDPDRLLAVIREELVDFRERFAAGPRRTVIDPSFRGFDLEDLVTPGGRRGHPLPCRLRQGPAPRRVPRAAARGTRADRDPNQAGGLRRPPAHRPHPRHPALLLRLGPRLLAQGLRGAPGGRERPRDPHREPAAARGRRTHQRGAAGPGLRPGRLRVHGDARRDRQEDGARGVLAPRAAPVSSPSISTTATPSPGPRSPTASAASCSSRAGARRSTSRRAGCGRWAALRAGSWVSGSRKRSASCPSSWPARGSRCSPSRRTASASGPRSKSSGSSSAGAWGSSPSRPRHGTAAWWGRCSWTTTTR